MPRLKRGETSVSVSQVSESRRASTRARLDILGKILGKSAGMDQFMPWMKSFESFAAWHSPELGIFKMTPKTLRKHVNAIHFGGQSALIAQLKSLQEADEKTTVLVSSEASERRAGAVLEMTARYLDLLDRLVRISLRSEAAATELKHHLSLHGRGRPVLHRAK